MDLDIDIKQDRVHITIMGPIDSAGGAELSTKFAELAKDPSLRHAEFDLSEVPSITSAGIGKLLAFYKHFDQAGGGMRITELSPQLTKQFKEIHLDKIIPIGI
ncbi:MAG: STAS domain-containing protein [Rectinemataceae bacterium]|jgi:anti-sigma B factor antagonist